MISKTLISQAFSLGEVAALRKLPENQNLDPDFLKLLDDNEHFYPKLSKAWLEGYDSYLVEKYL